MSSTTEKNRVSCDQEANGWRAVPEIRARRDKILTGRLMTMVLSLLPSLPAGAEAGIESLANIENTASAYARHNASRPGYTAQAEVSQLDARLRLTACSRPLRAFSAPGARATGATTIGVRCEGEKPWTVYVQANVRLFGPVLVASRSLSKGSEVISSDVRIEQRDISGLTGALGAPADAVGWIVRRPIDAGAVLTTASLEPARVVKRGDRVILVAGNAGLEVRMAGEALGDGAIGASVQVRNLLSKKVIQGTVAAAGLVRVPL